ncbi:MAG TPA: DUF1508 domain-containing protein, partial [Phenylobacterium sp.]|nr:DUF1508 domain-containing protein [Phenylobacterium sp.]
KDKAGEFRVRFSYNGETLFSTEGYSTKQSAKNAIEAIRRNVGIASTNDLANDQVIERGGVG